MCGRLDQNRPSPLGRPSPRLGRSSGKNRTDQARKPRSRPVAPAPGPLPTPPAGRVAGREALRGPRGRPSARAPGRAAKRARCPSQPCVAGCACVCGPPSQGQRSKAREQPSGQAKTQGQSRQGSSKARQKGGRIPGRAGCAGHANDGAGRNGAQSKANRAPQEGLAVTGAVCTCERMAGWAGRPPTRSLPGGRKAASREKPQAAARAAGRQRAVKY